MQKAAWIAAVIFAAVSSPPEAGEIPRTAFASGNWSGAAYTDDETGQFSHCAMSGSYVSGDDLLP